MRSLTFIGLGLYDEKGITVEGLEEAKRADSAFAEFYTNLMPGLSIPKLEQLIGKKVHVLRRVQLEDQGGLELVRAVEKGSVAFLVPGDPMVATTHISLRLALSKAGITCRIVHGPSITSAICGATGLQSYKFGKTITIPYDPPLPWSVPTTIADNYQRGLHTLLLLDLKENQENQLKIPEALARLIETDPAFERKLAIGVARLGARDEKVKAATMGLLGKEDFGGPPQSIVAAGKLHFMEAEALKTLANAEDSVLGAQS